jgi:hypothetical protein
MGAEIMDKEQNVVRPQEEVTGSSARRRFLRTSGRVAVAAPAVALLMAAQSKGVSAQTAYGQPTTPR